MSFLSLLSSAIPFASSFFGKKNEPGGTVTPTNEIPGYQDSLQNQYSTWISQYLNNFQPGAAYSGDLTAQKTPFESMGLDQLNSFLTGPGTGELFQQGQNQIMDTLGGKYMNPQTNPWIQSMMTLSNRNLNSAIDQTRARRGARGTYYTKDAIREESDLTGSTLDQLNAIIGQMQNQERGRQFAAAPLAQEFDKYQNMDVPLQKIGASQTFGSLDRTIQQADLERKYSDFLRQREEQQLPMKAAGSLYGTSSDFNMDSSPFTLPNQQSNNTIGNIMDLISKMNLGGFSGSGSIWDKLKNVVSPVFNPGY